MRRTFESQFNRLQVVLFCLLASFALIAVAPQALAHPDGEPVVVEIDVVDGALTFEHSGLGFSAMELRKAAKFASENGGSLDGTLDVVRPPTFFEWKSRDGSLSFTDREKQIPALYRTSGAVAERKWSDLDARVTVSAPPVKPRVKKLPVPVRAPDKCTQPTRMDKEWEMSRGPENHVYRRLITSVVEGCGTVTYRGTASPRVELNR